MIISDFHVKCSKAISKQEIYEVVDLYLKYFYSRPMMFSCLKTIYNNIIGWALPSKKVCNEIIEFMNSLPYDTCLVDLGAGSGIFSYMFHLEGLSKDRIIGVDIIHPTHVCDEDYEGPLEKRNFWPILRDDKYIVHPNNVLFIAWGTYSMYDIMNRYIADGGKYIILLGESESGCTSPSSDYFEKIPEWKVRIIHVPGPVSKYMEHLSINIRI